MRRAAWRHLLSDTIFAETPELSWHCTSVLVLLACPEALGSAAKIYGISENGRSLTVSRSIDLVTEVDLHRRRSTPIAEEGTKIGMHARKSAAIARLVVGWLVGRGTVSYVAARCQPRTWKPWRHRLSAFRRWRETGRVESSCSVEAWRS